MTEYQYAQLIINENDFYVPTWILDDVGYFYPEIYNHIVKEKSKYVIYNNDYLKKFKQLRKQIYWMCHWYSQEIPMLEANI